MITPVPRAEAKRLYPDLRGQRLWGEQSEYDPAECRKVHWIVYSPVEPKALVQAMGLFKSARVVNKGEST